MTMSAPVLTDASPSLTGGCRTLHLPAEAEAPGLTLWVNKPSGERPPPGWPALILLDGEAYFTAAAEMAQRLARRSAKTRVDPMIIVGVTLDHAHDRHAAFRFDTDQSSAPPRGRQLLRRLVAEVLPLLAADGADPAKLTLMGHSMSGLFVLEARAAAAPFARHIAISPSIWGTPGVVTAQPSRSECFDDLIVIVGGLEEIDGLSQAHLDRRMISNARSLVDRGGVRFNVLDGEDHGSAPYASLPAALRFASQHEPFAHHR